MADFTIGGAAATPSDSSYVDQPGATVASRGDLEGGCRWTLEIVVAVATLPVPERPNCVYHFYRVRTTLSRICPGETKTSTETRVTRTGPHCGDPAANPPVAIPKPRSDSAFKGSKKPDKGPEEVSLELPDGTKVTVTLPRGRLPGVKLDYPSGTPTTLPPPGG